MGTVFLGGVEVKGKVERGIMGRGRVWGKCGDFRVLEIFREIKLDKEGRILMDIVVVYMS